MAEDSWRDHIGYLEEEVKKLGERADKLEAMIPDLESEQKRHALRELVFEMRRAPPISMTSEATLPPSPVKSGYRHGGIAGF